MTINVFLSTSVGRRRSSCWSQKVSWPFEKMLKLWLGVLITLLKAYYAKAGYRINLNAEAETGIWTAEGLYENKSKMY